jgi:hypothetical protein
MDYRAIIEKQIESLEKVQERILKDPAYAEVSCSVAKTIEYLCVAAHRWPTINTK